MARTKRNQRTARKVAVTGALQRLKASALSSVGTLVKQGHTARQALSTGATQARIRTTDAAKRFERAFEHRVSQAMSRIGVPTARDVRALSRQVAQLQHSVDQLRRSRARA